MAEKSMVKVWDIAVRVFHWSLVVLFFVAYFTGDDEDVLHVYAGYGVLALVVFRIVWGFVGTQHARFSDFIYGPAATLRYVKSLFSPKPLHYLGHNPLGGWMVVALLLSLIGTCWSGLRPEGPRAPRAGRNRARLIGAGGRRRSGRARRQGGRGRGGVLGRGPRGLFECHALPRDPAHRRRPARGRGAQGESRQGDGYRLQAGRFALAMAVRQKKRRSMSGVFFTTGAGDRNRTDDLRITSVENQ